MWGKLDDVICHVKLDPVNHKGKIASAYDALLIFVLQNHRRRYQDG